MAERVTHESSEAPFVNWREFDPSWLPGGTQSALATELMTYRDHLDEILQHGKSATPFVAIKGTEILGYYRSRQRAVVAAVSRFGTVPVLIKRIVELEPVRSLGGADV